MARNRILYQSEAVFTGPTPATGAHFSLGNSGTNLVTQLHRVQSVSSDLNITRTDINQLGQLASITREIIEAPTVSASVEYYLTNILNEKRLGFLTDGTASAISGFLSKAEDEKNLFILTVPEGADAAGYVGAYANRQVVGIGNAFVSNYTAQGSVGSPPTASVDFEALNFRVYPTASGQNIPAVNPENGQNITGFVFTIPSATTGVADQVGALRPGDITLDLAGSTVGLDLSDAKIQDFNISIPLSRETLQKLGSKFGFSKELTFPIQATMSVNMNVGELTSGNLSDVLCNDVPYNLTVNMRKPSCSGNNGEIAVRYVMKGAKIDTQSIQSSVGGSKTASVTWSTQIGGPEDNIVGVFISGVEA